MTIHFSNLPATFINIPKTGTSSLRDWCFDNAPDAEFVYEFPEEKQSFSLRNMTQAEMTARWNNLGTTFTFVRNPYDRLVSIFHHIGQDVMIRIRDRKNGIERGELHRISIESDIKILSIYNRGFEHWVMNLPRMHEVDLLDEVRDKSMLHYLDNIVPDIVIKLENIDQEFKKVQELLNCYAPMLHVNSSKHSPYREYYNDTTRKIVGDWYKKDLDTFNYDF